MVNPLTVSLPVSSSTFIEHGGAVMLKIKEKAIRKSIFSTRGRKVFFAYKKLTKSFGA